MSAASRYREAAFAVLADARRRRLAYAVLAIVLAVLCFVPRPWVARAKVLPQDTSSAGLGQVLNQLGGNLATFAGFLGSTKPPNDLYLIVARSDTVQSDVIAALRLVGDGRPYPTAAAAKRALSEMVDIRLLLGGVLEVETRTRDANRSIDLTGAYVQSIGRRVGLISRQALDRKRSIVMQRYNDAAARLRDAEARLDAFRQANRLAAPEIQLGSEISLRTNLQARLAAKLVEQRTLQQTAGPENPALLSVAAEITALRGQIADAERPRLNAAGPSVGGLSALQSRYLDLYRNFTFAQLLYNSYTSATEQIEVENLAAASATFVQVVEPAHLDAERHYNTWAVGALAALVLVAVFTELYVPLTGLRWPELRQKTDADVDRR